MSAELWARDASGVNRKFCELWAQDGTGVNRKLKELWANDGTGVSRKIFQSGLQATLGTEYSEWGDSSPIYPINAISNGIWTAGVWAYKTNETSYYYRGGSINIPISDPLEIAAINFNAVSAVLNTTYTTSELQFVAEILNSTGAVIASKSVSRETSGIITLSIPVNAIVPDQLSIRAYVGWNGSGGKQLVKGDKAYWSIPSRSIALSSGDEIYF